MSIFLRIYDFFSTRQRGLWTGLVLLISVMGYMAATLSYKEDIADFLPVDNEYKESMAVYQQISEASRIVIIFEGSEPDELCDAIDAYEAAVIEREADSVVCSDRLTTMLDIEGYLTRLRYVHANVPFFLTEADYTRLDSLFSEEAIRKALMKDKQILSMPGTGLLKKTMASDPLAIFPITMGASGQYAGAMQSFTSYAGYMMTADQTKAFAFYDSPNGSMESAKNARLADGLQELADSVMLAYPAVNIRLLGAPVIAVGNARRIKFDSICSIVLALVLITLLLLYAFPRFTDILLILLSVGFGWLFGMAMLRVFAVEVSAIVLGIGSIIVGIAVNYPLHLLVHQRYTTSVRQTLEEVLAPLVVGNITTVGAFLALLPIKANAIRDLGIFASAMLFGTILFCIIVLPHLMSAKPTPIREIHFLPLGMRDRFPASRHPWAMGICLVLISLGAGLFSATRNADVFDSNLSHINYMTPQQRADFAYFDAISGQSDAPAYLASSAREELTCRQYLWMQYWTSHSADSVIANLQNSARDCGFSEDAFKPFVEMLSSQNWASVNVDELPESELAQLWPGRFDSAALNSRVAKALSDNFDYLGFVCSLVVLIFLCISFRSLLLGLIAFLPMALSWIWIMALMTLFDMHFNIVNVILATFIFGQGDDYTIFILEGLLYEERTGKKMLPQYKQSILLSALIMLIGIGVLIIAQHPAMHSLGAVTLVGMACVLVMAYLVPPVLLSLAIKIPWVRNRIIKGDKRDA